MTVTRGTIEKTERNRTWFDRRGYHMTGETLKLGFSHAADPLNPDPSWEERGRPNTYAGATPPNYGPNYRKHTA